MARTLAGAALALRENERITIQYTGDDLEPWVVMRGGGRANEAVESAILNSLVYSPDMDLYFVRGEIVKTGAQFIVRH